MIEYIENGNIFKSEAHAYVNPVNCVGVMGKGLAWAFQVRFPGNFESYEKICSQHRLQPGKVFVVRNKEAPPPLIINLPTKRHWVDESKLDDIVSGLQSLAKALIHFKAKSVAVPALGCGLGGLDWDDIKPAIEAALGQVNGLHVEIYEPRG